MVKYNRNKSKGVVVLMIILYIFLVVFFLVALVATYENHLYSITYGRNSFLGILVIISSLVAMALMFIAIYVFQ
nr:MAG: hypothetical protein [Bacteriophage sp.]